MNRKSFVIILLIILFLSLNVSKVHAYIGDLICTGDSPGGGGSGGGGGGSGGGGGGGGGSPGCPGEGRFVYCNIADAGTDENIKLEENLYDTNGDLIGSALQIQDKYVLISGRFVGIDAYEDYRKTFYVSINPVCKYGHIEPHTIHHPRSCDEYEDGNWYTYDCSWDEIIYVLECDTCSVSVSECRGQANARLAQLANTVDLNESYIGKRQDVNDIEKGVSGDRPLIDVTVSDKYIDRGHPEPADQNSSTVWQTVQKRYTYNLTPAWIDPLTGKVKYENNCGSNGDNASYNTCYNNETDKDYIKVFDEDKTVTRPTGEKVRIGWYFVPLNAKSTDLLRYNLVPRLSTAAISESMCLALIEKYKTKNDNGEYWANFIAFKGSGEPMYPTIQSTASAINQVKSDHGCRMGLYTAFKIQQEFYHEKNGVINGYNFYYRPIDYTEPFPNGIISNDYWYKVYNHNNNTTKVENSNGKIDKNNSKDLDESFAKITYATTDDYSTGTIREYNHKKEEEITDGYKKVERIYSSWSEMNASGTSKFISGNYGVSRQLLCKSYYKLGCGPSNSNWKQCGEPEVCS